MRKLDSDLLAPDSTERSDARGLMRAFKLDSCFGLLCDRNREGDGVRDRITVLVIADGTGIRYCYHDAVGAFPSSWPV